MNRPISITRLLKYVEPVVHWCGTENCLHRNNEHGLNNKCLVCDCQHYSDRTYGEDMVTILKFVDA